MIVSMTWRTIQSKSRVYGFYEISEFVCWGYKNDQS